MEEKTPNIYLRHFGHLYFNVWFCYYALFFTYDKPIKFNAELWKSKPNERWLMKDDLRENKLLEGSKQKKVVTDLDFLGVSDVFLAKCIDIAQ